MIDQFVKRYELPGVHTHTHTSQLIAQLAIKYGLMDSQPPCPKRPCGALWGEPVLILLSAKTPNGWVHQKYKGLPIRGGAIWYVQPLLRQTPYAPFNEP